MTPIWLGARPGGQIVRWMRTFSGELVDDLANGGGGHRDPLRGVPSEGDGRGGNAFISSVHSSHFSCFRLCVKLKDIKLFFIETDLTFI